MFTQKLMEKMETPFREQLRRMKGDGGCGKKAEQVERLAASARETDLVQALKCQ